MSAALDTGLCLLLLLPFADVCGNDSETKCPACYWKSERLLVEHCLNGETEDGAGFLHSDPNGWKMTVDWLSIAELVPNAERVSKKKIIKQKFKSFNYTKWIWPKCLCKGMFHMPFCKC